RSQVDMIRAQIAYSQNRGSDAPALLLRAARRLEPLDLRMARQTYLDAVLAGHFAGRLAPGSLREAAQAARRVPPAPGPAVAGTPAAGPAAASDLLLDGLATALTGGYAAGVPTLKQAVRGFRGGGATPEEQLRWLWPAAHVAMALWDDESYDVLSARHIEIGREAGALAVLPTALTTRIVACAFAGQLTAAEELIEEMRALTAAMGTPAPAYGPVFVSAWRGREEEALAVIGNAVREFTVSGEGAVLAFADYGRAVLCNGLGRYQEALAAAAATDALEDEGVTIVTQGLAELVEAAARAGRPGAPGGDDQGQRHRLGSGCAGSLAGAGQRRRHGRAALPRSDRAARRHPHPPAAGARPPGLRRMAAPGQPARRRPARTAPGVRDVRRHGDRSVFRARAARAGGHRGEGKDAGRGKAARSHQARGADRPARPRRTDERRDRVPALPERANRGMAPAEGLHQARDLLPPTAPHRGPPIG